MNELIQGSVESIEQAIQFLSTLSDTAYQSASSPFFESAIGQHIRHTLDAYFAVMSAAKDHHCDYDLRRRGTSVEIDKALAIEEFELVKAWMLELDRAELDQSISIATDVGINQTRIYETDSTLGREICFVSSHLIHHLALMAAIAKSSGVEVSQEVGVAPATASFIRSESR